MSVYRFVSVLFLSVVFLIFTTNAQAMVEYYVEGADGQVYLIPVGEPYEDEYGLNLIQATPIEDFYIMQNGIQVYPDSKTAAELYATSRALSHLLGFPYLDASNEVSTASYNASHILDDLTEQQKDEIYYASSASFVGGVMSSWAIGAAICVGSAGTACVAGAVWAVAGTAISAVDAISTAYSENHDSFQVISREQTIYYSGQALMNKGFKIQLSVEAYIQQTNSSQNPAKVQDIAVFYRDLGQVSAYYKLALDKFDATGALPTRPVSKRVVGAWGVGAIPAGSTIMGVGEYIREGGSIQDTRDQILSQVSSEEQRISTIDVFAEFKQDEYQNFFSTNWGTIDPPLPDISISLSITERSDPGKMRIIVNHTDDVKIKDLYAYIYDFGDGQGLNSVKATDGSLPAPLVDHIYKDNGSYTVFVEFVAMDGRKSTATTTIQVDHAPVDVEYSPSGRAIYPEYSTDHVVGDEVEFQVRGFDVDENLSHVIWTYEGPLQLLESDNYDGFGSSENREGYEEMTVRILGDNNGENFYMYATVYDELGNQSDRVRWVLEARQSFVPVLNNITPVPGELSIPLGQEIEFFVTVSDADDNAGDLIWKVDGVVVEEDSTGGGNPESIENYDFQVYERGAYDLSAEVTDDDGNTANVQWTITAGSSIDGNIAPTIDFFALDPYELPYTVFRVGKGYEFEFVANDLDANLIEIGLYVDDVLIRLDQRNSGTDSDRISEMLSFSSPGTHIIKATAKDQGDLLTEETLTVTVLEADGTEGISPQITHVYPSFSTIYLPLGDNLTIGGNVYDPEWDMDQIDVYLNGNKIRDYSIKGQSNFDFSLNDALLPTSGTHQLRIVPVDAGGKEGTAKTWSLVIGQGSNRPTIQRVIPNVDDPIYVLADDSNPPRIYVFAEDADGDLDRIEYDWSGVGDPDPIDSSSMSRHYDDSHQTFHPTRSGVVLATVFDEGGRSNSISFNVIVVQGLNNNPPEILNCNIPDGADYERVVTDSGYDISLAFDAYDPDGDLQSIELFEDGNILRSYYNLNDYEQDNTLLSTGYDSDFDRFPGPDNRARGDRAEYLLRLTDSMGNVTERSFSVTQGPTGDNNHPPVAQESINITVDQRESVIFQVPITDEEGDEPEAMPLGLPIGHQLRVLAYNEFEYTPDPSFSGSVSFTLSWNDGFGGADTTTVNATVNYVPLTYYPVNLIKDGTGVGAVVSDPAGINCGASCNGSSGEFLDGATVSLNAIPEAGSIFEGWGGDGCAGLGGCTLNMDAAKNVTAIFYADSDGDGVSDQNDQCATDPLKTVPGICGCNNVDSDSDNDGTFDCFDSCPVDANKTEFGICGCGVQDVDSDFDGVEDCIDECPADPEKTTEGSCGCGNSEEDLNSNGIPDCAEQVEDDMLFPVKGKDGNIILIRI